MPVLLAPTRRDVHDVTRREFLGVLAAAGLLAGCGGDGAGAEAEADAASLEVPSGEGTVRIPADSARIVTTTHGWDAAVALGQQERVVGVMDFEMFVPYVEYLADTATPTMTPLGSLGEELERLAALRPEVIVAPYWNTKGLETRAELAALAPLVEMVVPGTPRPYDDWKGSLRAYGEILGARDRADAYVAEQEAAAATLRGDLDEGGVAGQTVTLAYFIGPDRGWRVDQRSNTASLVLADLALPRPAQPPLRDGGVELSLENTALLDADHVWVYPADAEAVADLEANPLWQQLGAVQAGTARIVPSYWNSGYALAIPRILDDIRSYLLGGR